MMRHLYKLLSDPPYSQYPPPPAPSILWTQSSLVDFTSFCFITVRLSLNGLTAFLFFSQPFRPLPSAKRYFFPLRV